MVQRNMALQTNFSAGMLDPTLASRVDVSAYKQGAKELVNVLGLPHGGVSLRNGLTFMAEIPDGGADARLIRFEFSTDQVYLLVLRTGAMDVFMPDGQCVATVTMPYTREEIPVVGWTQSLDTLILVHPNHPPAKLMRQGSHTVWKLSDLKLKNLPTYAFERETEGDATPSATTGKITVTSTKADFADAKVGYVISMQSGRARITALNSPTSVAAEVMDDFTDTTAAKAGLWTVQEPVWSADRGWPCSVFLHQGRLYFGGSKSRPQTIWGSRSNDFFDFETTNDALDDESVEMTFDNDRVCAVRQLYALNNFFAFTSGGLFARSDGEVVTPSKFTLKRSSEVPSAAVRPAELDGSVLFIKSIENGHSSVYELAYSYEIESYKAEDVALLSGSLMRQPCDMAARLGNEQDSANHLYVVNGADGSVAVMNSRKSQNMTGWSLLQTCGDILKVAVVGGVPYFLIRRSLNGVERYFIEKLDPSARLDSSVRQQSGTEQDTWSGLSRLNGVMVHLIGDGSPLGQAMVVNGKVETPYPVRNLEVGFAFNWVVETMPIDTGTADGMSSGGRHRITKAAIRFHNSAGMTVNGRSLLEYRLGDEVLDKPPVAISGLRNIRFLGWSGGRLGQDGATVRIEGNSSLPATILSVASEVAQ